eukprot:935116-Pleurochrysis_carterae.AAC.2
MAHPMSPRRRFRCCGSGNDHDDAILCGRAIHFIQVSGVCEPHHRSPRVGASRNAREPACGRSAAERVRRRGHPRGCGGGPAALPLLLLLRLQHHLVSMPVRGPQVCLLPDAGAGHACTTATCPPARATCEMSTRATQSTSTTSSTASWNASASLFGQANLHERVGCDRGSGLDCLVP